MNRHDSSWGWLLVLFAFIIVLQAFKQEQAKRTTTPNPTAVVVQSYSSQSNPIDISGSNSCSRNALNVLAQLGTVTIPAGYVWSFNDSWNGTTGYEYCAGVEGGYVCNVAAAYARVADELGLDIEFVDHGCAVGDLGQGGCNYQVLIWNTGDRTNPEDQDLLITNTSDRPVTFSLVGDRIVGVVQ